MARDDLRNGHAFILGLVREHRARDDVADGINALEAGGEMRIDLHTTTGIERDAGFLQTQAIGVRHAADADEHDVGFDGLGRTARSRFDFRKQCLAVRFDAGDLRTKLERKSLLFEDALELLRDLAVHAGQDAIEEFDDHDFGPESAPHRAKLEADHTGADDQQSALRPCPATARRSTTRCASRRSRCL